MKTLSSIVESLLNTFQIICRSYKKVFFQLQKMSRTYRNVWFGIKKIAFESGVSERQAKRAIAFFRKMEWISVQKRAYQSNIYFMNEDIIYLNLHDNNTFRKKDVPLENGPQDGPVLVTNYKEKNIHSQCETVCVQKNEKFRTREAKEYTEKDKKGLIAEFSEYVYAKAKEKVQWWLRQGNKPANIYAVMRGMCIKIKNGVIK